MFIDHLERTFVKTFSRLILKCFQKCLKDLIVKTLHGNKYILLIK